MSDVAKLMAKHARPPGYLLEGPIRDLVWSPAHGRAIGIEYGSCLCGHGLTDSEWLDARLSILGGHE